MPAALTRLFPGLCWCCCCCRCWSCSGCGRQVQNLLKTCRWRQKLAVAGSIAVTGWRCRATVCCWWQRLHDAVAAGLRLLLLGWLGASICCCRRCSCIPRLLHQPLLLRHRCVLQCLRCSSNSTGHRLHCGCSQQSTALLHPCWDEQYGTSVIKQGCPRLCMLHTSSQ